MRKLWTLALAGAIAAAAIPHTADAAAGQAQIQASVSFRTAPNTSSQVTAYLKAGEVVSLLEQVNAHWYKVQTSSGAIGYVSAQSQYIRVLSAPTPDNSSGQSNAQIKKSVSFRTAASTDAARIRYLQTGEQVQIVGQPNAYWYEVLDSAGTRGFISSSTTYVTVSGSVPSTGGGTTTPTTNPSGSFEQAIAAGMTYLGTPYQYGSDRNSTAAFDCSAFVRRAFLDGMGITLPADSRQQGDYVKKIGKTSTSWSGLKRGDLMFFSDYKGTSKSSYTNVNKATATITHVAIYLGNGQVLHTYSKASGGVRTDSIQGKHWEYRFLFGGSVS